MGSHYSEEPWVPRRTLRERLLELIRLTDEQSDDRHHGAKDR